MEAKYKVFALLPLCMMISGIPAYAQWTDAQQINTSKKTSNYQSTNYQTYVIHTYGGSSLIPAVRQTLEGIAGGSTVSSYQDKLVLRTTPAGYEAVIQLLEQIDGVPQTLTVSVRVGNTASSTGNIQQGQVIISNGRIVGGATVANRSGYQQSNNLYRVQTLSNKPASISTSTLLSLMQSQTGVIYNRYSQPIATIKIGGQTLTTATQGIALTPRVLPSTAGYPNQIQVAISQVHDTITHQRHTPIHSQQLNTTVTIPKGQWVSIGEVAQSQQASGTDWGQSMQTSYPIQIMVQ